MEHVSLSLETLECLVTSSTRETREKHDSSLPTIFKTSCEHDVDGAGTEKNRPGLYRMQNSTCHPEYQGNKSKSTSSFEATPSGMYGQ